MSTDPSSWTATAEVMRALLPHLPSAGRLQEYCVWDVWDEVVGEAMARKARPRKIQNGRLFVAVSQAMWMHELQFFKGLFKARLNQRLGAAIVKDIFFVVGDRRDASPRPAASPRRQLPPFRELTVPVLGHPKLEAALAALLAARRRRLVGEEHHGRVNSQKPS